MIIHIDCNSFYASCEIIFRPDLQGKPVVVANCNEAGGGIILALSKEAKAIGLKRGNPIFQVKEIIEKNNVAVFPANLVKYCDISRRIMQVVIDENIVHNFIQYSVDEFFGTILEDDPDKLKRLLLKLKDDIERGIGVPVSCGASTSYTLAKAATWYAKHYPAFNGVCILPKEKITAALERLPVEEVWGIGRASKHKLDHFGIHTADDFVNKQESFIKRFFSITGVRTWKELQGEPCINIDDPPQQRSIMHSRTFTYMTDNIEVLNTYMSNFVAAATRKLRDQHSVCRSVTVYIVTNRHREDLPQYNNSASMQLTTASSETPLIIKTALVLLGKIYRSGYNYKKAGIILSDIASDRSVQLDLFADSHNDHGRQRRLMAAADSINTRYGMNKIRIASQGFEESKLNLNCFQPLKNQTTNIDDIIQVKSNK